MAMFQASRSIRQLTRIRLSGFLRKLASLSNGDDQPFKDEKLNDMIASYQGGDHEFAPYRDREQAAGCISYHQQLVDIQIQRDQPLNIQAASINYPDAETMRSESIKIDVHIDNYDKQGSISLHSVMQSMVPEPFQPSKNQNPGPGNMPGGQVHQQISLRYTSEERSGRNDPAGEIV